MQEQLIEESQTETDSNHYDLNDLNDLSDVVTLSIDEPIKVAPYVLLREGIRHALYYGENRVGRDSDNDLMIENLFISRKHATLIIGKDETIEVKDHSTNGSQLNSERFHKRVVNLKVGDRVSFSVFEYVLEKVESSNYQDQDQDQLQDEIVLGGLASETAYVQRCSNSGSNSGSGSNNSSSGSKSASNQYSVRNRLKNLTSLNEKRVHAGFSLIELLVVIVVLGIIASISILNITSSRRAANSASAVQSLRVITTSQASYSTGAGNGEYGTADDLAKDQYIDSSLAAATLPTPANLRQQPKSGYIFVFNRVANNPPTNTLADYQISARPLLGSGLARAGDKSFFVDSTGVIRFSPSPIEPFADAKSQPIN